MQEWEYLISIMDNVVLVWTGAAQELPQAKYWGNSWLRA